MKHLIKTIIPLTTLLLLYFFIQSEIAFSNGPPEKSSHDFGPCSEPDKTNSIGPNIYSDMFDDVVAVGTKKKWHCSGVLITENVVLTAKHCLPAARIFVGQNIYEHGLVVKIKKAVSHPNKKVDAALLYLEKDLPYKRLFIRKAEDDSPIQGVLRLAGFGAIDSKGRYLFGIKHFTDVPATGWDGYKRYALAWGFNPASEMALKASGGRDTCDGDSGGPVYEIIPTHYGCAWRLVAITSRPIGGSKVRCGHGGIYTKVNSLGDWLPIY